MSLPQYAFISESAYLAAEKDGSRRHEYVAGRVYAMAGASKLHARIAGNLFYRIRSTMGESGCLVVQNDLKVRVRQESVFYYPDVVVTCLPDEEELYYTEKPCFIAEVLSPGTETIDRREKVLAYRCIPNLKVYVLADSHRRHVEYFIRDANNAWRCALLEDREILHVDCEALTFTLTLNQIYEHVSFNAGVAEEPAAYGVG